MGTTLSILIFLMTLGFVIMKDKELKNTCTNCKSFRWGYFIGCFFLITAALNIFLLIFGAGFFLGWVGFIANLMDIGRLNPGIYFIYLISVLIFSYLMIERHKVGWIVGSVLFFNPVIWIINFFYGKKRWSEFDGYINIKFCKLNRFKNSENPKDSRPDWMKRMDKWEQETTPEEWQKAINERIAKETIEAHQSDKKADD